MAVNKPRLTPAVFCIALAQIVAGLHVASAQSLLQSQTFLDPEMQSMLQSMRTSTAARLADGQLTVTNRYLEAEASVSPLGGTAQIVESMERGVELLQQGDVAQAVGIFDPLLLRFEQAVSEQPLPVFVARTRLEGMYYTLAAAAQDVHVQPIFSYGANLYYWRSLAAVLLGDRAGARDLLTRAIELSPANAWFLEQFGELLKFERDWQLALEYFERSVIFARRFSVSPDREIELEMALKGGADSLVELDRLEDARARYEAALAVDANDLDTQADLAYVSELIRRR